MSWSSRKQKEGIFCTIYFVRRYFFKRNCVLSQCIVCRIHFQNIHTFTYQKKPLLHTLFSLFLKSSKAFSVSLSRACYSSNHELHCVKSVRIQNFSGPCFPVFGLNREIYSVNIRIQSGCGKIRTRKTPNMDTFYRVLLLAKLRSYDFCM